MKTIKNFILVAFLATAATACQKEMIGSDEIPTTGSHVTFTGEIDEAQTKTFIQYEAGFEDGVFTTLFTSSDKITVNGKQSPSTTTSEDRTSIEFEVEDVAAPYFAVTTSQVAKEDGKYVGFNDESKTYTLQIAGKAAPQKYTKVTDGQYTSFQSNTDILAAYSENENLHFQHMSTFYAVTVAAESAVKDNIKTIYVCQGDENYSNIAGRWYLQFDKEDNYKPILKPSTLTSLVAFDCGEEGLAHGTTMIIGLPAYNYESGLVFTLLDVNGNLASYKVRAEKTQHAADGGKLIPFKPAFNPNPDTVIPGLITTAAQWNAFAEFMSGAELSEDGLARWFVNGTVKLGADIKGDLASVTNLPAGYVVDGNGKKITRPEATAALFGTVSGEVKNLTLAGNFTATASQGDAPFASTLNAGGKISGCTNEMTISFDKADHAYVAGIVKKMTGGTIENCVNNGSINVKLGNEKGNKNVGIGGIVGQIDGSGAEMLVKDCLNKAAITFAPVIKTTDDGSAACGVGGVVGWMRRAEVFTLENCDNEGNVTYSAEYVTSTSGSKTYPICVGGIVGVGSNYGGSVIDDVANGINVSITGCDNKGTVYNCGSVNTTTKASGKRAFTGGLAGFLLGQDGNYAKISSCTNTGAVYTYDLTGEGASTMPYLSSVVGGLVGFGGYLNMDKCTVNCEIGCKKRALMSLGGVIGLTVRPFILTNSNVHIEGYYNRISNYQDNRAIVASVPTYYGGNTNNPMTITPDIKGSRIADCKVGGHIYATSSALSTTNGAKTDDLSGSDFSVTLFNSTDKIGEGVVCGQGIVLAEGDLTVENITYWNGK